MSVRSFLRERSPATAATIIGSVCVAALGLIFLAGWGVTGDWQIAYRVATGIGILLMLLIVVGGIVAPVLLLGKSVWRLWRGRERA